MQLIWTIKPSIMPPPKELVELAMNEGGSLALLTVDHLIRKGINQPIPTGGIVVGWLMLIVPGISADDLKSAKVDLSFQDVKGKFWRTDGIIELNTLKIPDLNKLQ